MRHASRIPVALAFALVTFVATAALAGVAIGWRGHSVTPTDAPWVVGAALGDPGLPAALSGDRGHIQPPVATAALASAAPSHAAERLAARADSLPPERASLRAAFFTPLRI